MNIAVTPQELPSGFCPSSYQELLNAFAQFSFVTFPSANSQIVWQANKPSDATVTWGQTDSLGRPVRIYRFAQGAWLSFHTTASGLTMWYFSTLPDFTTFDGGDANPAGPASGPMWQQAKDSNGTVIAARFPLTAGTLPSAKVLSLGDVGGEENHSLTLPETAPHTHLLANADVGDDTKPLTPGNNMNSSSMVGGGNAPDRYVLQGSLTTPTLGQTGNAGGAGTPAVVTPHNCLPPYVVGFLLQRTSRLFYSVT